MGAFEVPHLHSVYIVVNFQQLCPPPSFTTSASCPQAIRCPQAMRLAVHAEQFRRGESSSQAA